jgi:hypothetical protein
MQSAPINHQSITTPLPQAALVFACGPSVMVAQLWDECLTHTWRGRRFDFHHETFEF